MRMLWSLPKAAPVLLRHLAAYGELAEQDLERARRDLLARLRTDAILAVAGLFALLMGCLGVVALTWDTRYRVAAIAWMGAGFLAVAVFAALHRAGLERERRPFLDTVRREWREDRGSLDRILDAEED